MKTKIRKINNISNTSIPVATDESTNIYLAPGESMENINIHNLDSIRKFVKVEQDLSEVPQMNENKKMLCD